jgi:hypothetical protein
MELGGVWHKKTEDQSVLASMLYYLFGRGAASRWTGRSARVLGKRRSHAATLEIGTDGDPVTFAAKASFSAGGSGNAYVLGAAVFFEPGQPTLDNF